MPNLIKFAKKKKMAKIKIKFQKMGTFLKSHQPQLIYIYNLLVGDYSFEDLNFPHRNTRLHVDKFVLL